MFVESRNDSREFFFGVWRKMSARQPLEPLEALVARIIGEHPEYHAVLEQPGRALEEDFTGKANPFLHMGLHIALIEQLQTDRPPGVRSAYQRLLAAFGDDAHAVEHRMMDCLAEVLWEAGAGGRAPDEQAYLAALGRLLP